MWHVLPPTDQADVVASTQIGMHFNTMSPTNGTLTEIATPLCRSTAWLTSRLCGTLNRSEQQHRFLMDLHNRIVFSNPVELTPLIVATRRLQCKPFPTQFHNGHAPSSFGFCTVQKRAFSYRKTAVMKNQAQHDHK
jgi:hypothetical protein